MTKQRSRSKFREIHIAANKQVKECHKWLMPDAVDTKHAKEIKL